MLERWLLAVSLITAVASPTSIFLGAVSPVFAEAFGGAWLPLSGAACMLAAAYLIAFSDAALPRRVLARVAFYGSFGIIVCAVAGVLLFAWMSAYFD